MQIPALVVGHLVDSRKLAAETETTDILWMAWDRSAAEALARRYVWWRPMQETLSNPSKLLCQILKMGTTEDYLAGIALWGEDAFREALQTALPGAIDDRSWAFWHRYYGIEMPPPPRRIFA